MQPALVSPSDASTSLNGVGFVVGSAFTAAVLGTIMQYLHTGRGPQELKDYFWPKREDGRRVRSRRRNSHLASVWRRRILECVCQVGRQSRQGENGSRRQCMPEIGQNINCAQKPRESEPCDVEPELKLLVEETGEADF